MESRDFMVQIILGFFFHRSSGSFNQAIEVDMDFWRTITKVFLSAATPSTWWGLQNGELFDNNNWYFFIQRSRFTCISPTMANIAATGLFARYVFTSNCRFWPIFTCRSLIFYSSVTWVHVNFPLGYPLFQTHVEIANLEDKFNSWLGIGAQPNKTFFSK